MRERARPAWTADQLADIYRGPHDHRVLGWSHDARVTTSITIGRFLLRGERPARVADLSCGNGIIANAFAAPTTILGDFAPGFPIVGPIEDTIHRLDGTMVDLFVCAETIEHLVDPDPVLADIRARSRFLVCSVPLYERPEEELNGEHLWVFDREGAEQMLRDAGWEPTIFAEVPAGPAPESVWYRCGIWGCA